MLYLCTQSDFYASDKLFEDECTDFESDFEMMPSYGTDEILARQLHVELNHETFAPSKDNESNSSLSSKEVPETKSEQQAYVNINDYKDVVRELSTKVNHDDQFFLVVRRGAPLSRTLSLWQRQSKKSNPTNVLRVKYNGDEGIDSGAIALEFLEKSVKEIRKVMFPGGSPVDSSYQVQCGNFRTCGEIIALPLAQGGPSPCFLEECSFETMFKEIDMLNIEEKHLTAKAVKLIKEITENCEQHVDLIVDHGYTGVVSQGKIEAIIRSVQVSFVSRRALYMKEFMIGLNV